MTEPENQADSSDYLVLQSPQPLPLAEISTLLREFYSGVLSFGEDRDSGEVIEDLNTASSNMPYGQPSAAYGQPAAAYGQPAAPAPGRAVHIKILCWLVEIGLLCCHLPKNSNKISSFKHALNHILNL